MKTLFLGLIVAGFGGSGVAQAQVTDDTAVCLDEDAKADLDAKRKSRSIKDRLVQKTNRHELGLRGGHFASDLFEATWVAGGAYTYYLTEDFAVEASAYATRLVSKAAEELERTYDVLEKKPRRVWLFSSNLVYVPLHAKVQSGSGIAHFDVSLTAGAGVVDSALSSGVAANAGIGFSFFVGRAVVLRLDVRDYLYRQRLLSRTMTVNDVAVTLGVGVLLPFTE